MRRATLMTVLFLTGVSVGWLSHRGRPRPPTPPAVVTPLPSERVLVSHPSAGFYRDLRVLPPDAEPTSADRRAPDEWVVTLLGADGSAWTVVLSEKGGRE